MRTRLRMTRHSSYRQPTMTDDPSISFQQLFDLVSLYIQEYISHIVYIVHFPFKSHVAITGTGDPSFISHGRRRIYNVQATFHQDGQFLCRLNTIIKKNINLSGGIFLCFRRIGMIRYLLPYFYSEAELLYFGVKENLLLKKLYVHTLRAEKMKKKNRRNQQRLFCFY